MNPRGDQTGFMSHVHQQSGIDMVSNLAESLVIQYSGVGTRPHHDQPGHIFDGDLLHLVIIQSSCFPVDAIENGPVEPSGEADPTAMGEMSPLVQSHAHYGIAVVNQCHIGRHIGY
ncbi:MAG: hypothetical protein DDT28_00700 [Dehalococcoidia bacterium]|nr:hypothetical protein [Chloroflexota bacterium]